MTVIAPPIVERPGWGAHDPLGPLTPWASDEPHGSDVHWEASGGHADHALCALEVRTIQAYHQRLVNGAPAYVDIAYNMCCCQHGVLFRGRDERHFQSAAQNKGNPYRRAICYVGGPLTPFTDAAKRAIAWWIALAPGGTPIPHNREVSCSTACPGPEISAWTGGDWLRLLAAEMHTAPVPAPPLKPLPAGGIHHPVLQQGAVGPAVLELQRKLQFVTGQPQATDGQFGPLTRTALANFQRFFDAADHLTMNTVGIADQVTWGVLDFCALGKGYH